MLQHDNSTVRDAIEAARTAGHVIGLTVVTVEEQAKGWFAAFNAARSHAKLANLSRLFSKAVELWGSFDVFPQTETSLERFDGLVAGKLNVGKMDLRIASIALDVGATIVTHNVRDFGRIPGLAIVDWTVSSTPPAVP